MHKLRIPNRGAEMLFFRACPRCLNGTVERGGDNYGLYLLCLNCGFMADLEEGTSAQDGLLEANQTRPSPFRASPIQPASA